MFTGLVADKGRLSRIRPRSAGLQLAVVHQLPGEPIAVGESIAVDGCCLTATTVGKNWFDADLSPETLERTGGRRRWREARIVNLERALRVGDRLGGHMVQGHVDGQTRLIGRESLGDGSERLRFELPREGRRLMVPKGSVALDGVSLTVARRADAWFEVAVIPETLRSTTLLDRTVGDALTIEYDILGKYALAALDGRDRGS